VRSTGWLPADAIASILVSVLVIRSAWRLVRESVDVLLEATPAHISLGTVRQHLLGVAGIESVHDLHVWTVSSGMVAMSAHAVVPEPKQSQQVLQVALAEMKRLGIDHVTLQVERDRICEAPCP
jgi:cobalt-zinc-cadmium efflux system protein